MSDAPPLTVEAIKASIAERIEEMRPQVEALTSEYDRLCAAQEVLSDEPKPTAKGSTRRGRPPGSKNKPKS